MIEYKNVAVDKAKLQKEMATLMEEYSKMEELFSAPVSSSAAAAAASSSSSSSSSSFTSTPTTRSTPIPSNTESLTTEELERMLMTSLQECGGIEMCDAVRVFLRRKVVEVREVVEVVKEEEVSVVEETKNTDAMGARREQLDARRDQMSLKLEQLRKRMDRQKVWMDVIGENEDEKDEKDERSKSGKTMNERRKSGGGGDGEQQPVVVDNPRSLSPVDGGDSVITI